MRIGILGGSFNPIHIGHLILAEYAKQALNLDLVLFIPCRKSAYKDKIIDTLPNVRLNMITSSIKETSYFFTELYELLQDKISYTVNTTRYLKKKYPKDELFLINGKDTKKRFKTWKDYKEIIKLVRVVFAGKDFYVPEVNIRSSLIRDLVREGKSIKHLVTPEVEKIICDLNLYKEGEFVEFHGRQICFKPILNLEV